ncbi:hypothetical protein [Paenibacillus sp. GCM10027626]|uniref:hypothetical protein n=1 Tax=Paenibacillus sp. GCM10027626 TaxID=3273411 RepID=UPI00363A0A3A
MENDESLLISAPNTSGEKFIKQLKRQGVSFSVIVNNRSEYERMEEIGVASIVMVNTNEEKTWLVPDMRIDSVYLFEKSLTLCCRYLQICRGWTNKPIYIVTDSIQPRHVYKGLGANDVIRSHGRDLSCLLADVKAREAH